MNAGALMALLILRAGVAALLSLMILVILFVFDRLIGELFGG